MSARARVETAIQAAGLEVVGLDRLEQMLAVVDAGFAAVAVEFDALYGELTASGSQADPHFVDAVAALREVVRLLDGPQSEAAQQAQDVAKATLARLDGAS